MASRTRRIRHAASRTRRKTKYWPPKYYAGLTRKQKEKKYKEIQRGLKLGYKNPAAYRVFKTNKGIKGRSSNYTQQWNRLFPGVKSLKDRAQATGVPLRFIQGSYDRGLAAWSTGHRPGATAQGWGYARVSSFLLCGKTHYTTDSDLVREAKAASASARAWWKRCAPSKLTT
jgi:hypothetical protein